ncbi:putative Ig domain-containing protein [Sulfurihydrogenibium azorense]|uniref:putative Ig domain-containing protein n=1 Tax=Sulfurihydrogenibium azorense TaxID=309806 RepID=UPI00391BE78D
MNRKGFSLLEMALVLVIIGVLLSAGITVFNILYKKSKLSQSEEILKAAVENLIGKASSDKCLPNPDTSNGDSNAPLLPTYIEQRQDSFLKYIRYIPAQEMVNPTCSTTSNICNKKTTSLAVILCKNEDCSSSETIDNVAFVVVSGGWNKNLQVNFNDTVTISSTSKRAVRVYYPNTIIDSYSSSTNPVYSNPNRAEEFDDIVNYITLDQLRTKIGCEGSQLKITTTELPTAYQNRNYSATVNAEGGVPFSTGGKYIWTYTLPTGLTGSPPSGNQGDNLTISSSPLNLCSGNYTVSITVRDSDNNQDSKVYTLSVQPDPIKISPHTAVYYAVNGSSYNNTIPLSIAGGKPSYTVSCSPTSCNGLDISCSTSSVNITGTPTTTGTCNFTITVSDSCGQSTTATYSVVIQDITSGGGSGGGGGGGSRRDFRLPNGTCRIVNNNTEITTTTSRLTSGTRITAFNSSNGTCSGVEFGYFDYSWVRCIDDDGDGLLNFNSNGSVTDR